VHRFHLRSLGYLASLGLLAGALVACTGGNGTSPAPGAFPPLSPGGTPHAQYVVVANVITPSLLTYNLGTGSIPNSGNLSPAYNNHSGTIAQPFFIFNDFNSNLWAANFSGAKLTWYSVSATGGAPVSHSISGGSTTLGCPTGVYISPNGTIYAADPCSAHGYQSIDVFAPGSSGNVAPTAWIGGGSTTLSFPQGIAVDSSGNLWVIDTSGPWIDQFPAALSAGQNNLAPSGKITSTAFVSPDAITIDYQKHIWVGDLGSTLPEVMEFNPTPGAQTPLCNISGSNTGMTSTGGQVSVAVDNGGYVYTVDATTPQINIFAKGQCGNPTPAYTISGGSTALTYPAAILVYSTGNDY
jgi:tripartite motif-containing protein 71